MVKWMYYLAVAMLLAAAADAAAVSVDVPAAVVDAGAVDVPAVAVDSSTAITLTKFSWIEETTKRGDTKYKSLEITFEEATPTITSGTCSIIYMPEEGGIEFNQEGTLEELKCTINLEDAGQNTLPEGSITYDLIVTDDNTDRYIGSATFEVNPADFNQGESGAISCGGVSYTRTIEDSASSCEGGVGVDLDGTNYACYVPTASARSSESQTTDGNGCIGLPDSSGIQVCLSDKKFLGVAVRPSTTIIANSLTYETPSLGITYTDDDPEETLIMELIVQDKADPKTFFVGALDSPTVDAPLAVPIPDYVPTSATYQVCGVLSATPSTTESVVETVESTAATPTEITDLNVFMVEDGTAELVEFGFNNARAGENRIYYATLADSATTPVETKVGIDCVGVEKGHICYGFLSTTSMDVDKTLTVAYGVDDGSGGIKEEAGNTIIGIVPPK